MLRAFFIFTCLTLSQTALATTPFRDAFLAFTKVRELEQRQKLLPFTNVEAPDLPEQQQRLAADLTAARIDFHSIARIDDKELTAWEKEVLTRVGKNSRPNAKGVDEQGLRFLREAFPKAQTLSLVEWDAVATWFGKSTEEAFLKTTFSAHDLPAVVPSTGATILWVRTSNHAGAANAKQESKKECGELRAQLEKAGYKLETLEITPFSKSDDQATELVQAVSRRKQGPVLLFSRGEASAVVYRALDLYAGFRKNPLVRGWVNWNGELYGKAPTESRKLASIASDPVSIVAENAQAEAYRVYGENMGRTPPLVQGFPIFNMISLHSSREPGRLRESIVAEGSTWLVPTDRNALTSAFSLASQAPADAGLRDSINDFGF